MRKKKMDTIGVEDNTKAFKDKIKKKKIIKRCILLVILLAIIIYIGSCVVKINKNMKQMMNNFTTEKVTIRDISTYITSSGIVNPLDSYSVTTTSKVEGTVLTADFEEGDIVKKGDTLYTLSTDDLDTQIDNANKTIRRGERNYQKALNNYDKAKKDYSDFTVNSDLTGYIKDLKVKVGDTIQIGSQIADIYNNKQMELYVPFNADEVNGSLIGRSAIIELTISGETMRGKVSKISEINETLSGNRVVRYVTIKIDNPGGISEEMTATASIGNINCNQEGTFRTLEEGTGTITSDITGKIAKIYYKEGNWISNGNVVLEIEADTYDNQLDTYKDQIEAAENNLEDAKDNLDTIMDSKTDYIVTSPITGTIITKNVKAGDTLNANNMNTALCTIYDLSAMTFKMQVDELDVMDVKIGQKVSITADAIQGKEFKGVITNVNLESNTNNGVTQYPVTVRINKPGELLPGMNVTGKVLVASASSVLTIPTNSLMRGNQVYVEDASVTEAVGDVPAGFRAVDVEVGISDGDFIEITSGLAADEVIYVPPRTSRDMMEMYMGGEAVGVEAGPADNGGGPPPQE